jgi:hypothetical protein
LFMICSDMSSLDHLPSDPASPANAWERALLDRQLERLDQLADMGMALAAEIQRRAATAPPDADITHTAMDFARVSRAVRMTLALQSKLVRDFKTPIKAPSGKAANDDGDNDDDSDFRPGEIQQAIYWADGTPISQGAERRVLRRTVRELAEDRGLDRETMERLETEAVERYDDHDLYPRYPARGNVPFHKMVGLICESLGLKPPDNATSPASGGGGPSAEEPMVVGAGQAHPASAWFDGDSS